MVHPWVADGGTASSNGVYILKKESRINIPYHILYDRMSYIILRDCWLHIIDLNVHAPTGDKTDDVKDRFYEELECRFDKFPI
jgi:hypothetical protein